MIVVTSDKSKSNNIYYQLWILSIQLSISRAHYTNEIKLKLRKLM